MIDELRFLRCLFRGHQWTHIAPINPYMRQWCVICKKLAPKISAGKQMP